MRTFCAILVYRGEAELDRDIYVYLLEAKDKAEALSKMNEWLQTDRDQPIEIKISEYSSRCMNPSFVGMTTLLISVPG